MTAIAAARARRRRGESLHAHRARLDRQIPRRRRRPAHRAASRRLLDGEIVALDDKGKPSFSALQSDSKAARRQPCLPAFDLLEIDGEELDELPNHRAQAAARRADRRGAAARHPLCRPYHRQGRATVRGDVRRGRKGSSRRRPTRPTAGARRRTGSRSNAPSRQEFVIVGWSESDKNGRGFRALLLGAQRRGKLRYAGKVGTGFSRRSSRICARRLDKLAAGKAAGRGPRAPRRAARIGSSPELVAEIAFAEFTADKVSCATPASSACAATRTAKEVVAEMPQPTMPEPRPTRSVA